MLSLIYDELALAVGLGMDAMSVSASVGVKWHGVLQKFRLAWHMGLFQFLMPIIGWSVGSRFAHLLRNFASWIAAILVFAIGAHMLYEAVRSRHDETKQSSGSSHKDPTKGWSLIVLSIATSIDALVAGVSLGLQQQNIWHVSVTIGIVAGIMALVGVVLGKRIGTAIGRPAEIIGSIVLMLLAVSFIAL